MCLGPTEPVTTLVFFVNGKLIIEEKPDPDISLLSYLRLNLKLCGTKLGCGEGGCGACTVMVSRVDREEDVVHHYAVNACLTPVCSVHGMAVTTVEGIGNTRTRLHPVQERIAKVHGSQCGFCTPGFVMSMYALLRSSPTPSMKDLEIAFQGNLCRCTGYRPIIEGYRTFTKEYQCAMGDRCCKNKTENCVNGENETNLNGQFETPLFEAKKFMPFDPSQDPIFPPSLRLSDQYDRQDLMFKSDRTTWYRPTSLESVLKLKSEFSNAKIVVGNTEIGVEVKFKKFHYPVLICVNQVKELNRIEIVDNGIKIGASVPLDKVEEMLKTEIKQRSESQTRIFKAIVKMFHYFAGKQIRNVASMGGAIMTGSPISDLNPILMAVEVELIVESAARGSRVVKMDNNFFTGYRKNILAEDEVLISLIIPFSSDRQHFVALKQSKRRDDDIAIVNIALNIEFENNLNENLVKQCKIVFGGMSPMTIKASKTSELAVGKEWGPELVECINQSLIEEIPLSEDAPGGMVSYRRSLTLSLFFKCYLMISNDLNLAIEQREMSGVTSFETLNPESTQFYKKNEDHKMLSVGEPIIHHSALKQATGEATYCDDVTKFEDECYMALVLSIKAHAKIVSIDATEALAMEGVIAFYCAKDILPELNKVGAVFKDEEMFISSVVTSVGQTIGIILADNEVLANRAVGMVKIEYEELFPIIVTIEDAIKYGSYLNNEPFKVDYGDVDSAFPKADHVVEGSFRIGGQEHFYMETQSVVVVPQDGDELKVYSATHSPTAIHNMIADVLNIPRNRISVIVKRLGGSFGGKEAKSYIVSVPAAFASYKLQRPVRCALSRDVDMEITGTRHPFLFKYKLGFDESGKMLALDVKLYGNGGFSIDLSIMVLEQACTKLAGAYKYPNVRIRGWMCKTNLPSNTAFRGFGHPQSNALAELLIHEVCRVTNQSYVEVVEKNIIRTGDRTFFNQKMEDDNMYLCYQQLLNLSDYHNRKMKVLDFNAKNRWKKRGLAIVNICYGIGFEASFMNQGGALVMIYSNGDVLVNHGGIEIGQGLHVKMIQVASTVLGIPVERIHITETATDKVPNTSPTAASTGSDLNGMAVVDACNKLNGRLKPLKEEFANLTWDQWIQKAYMQRISLSATGFYKTPEPYGDPEHFYNYFTNGSVCSEVEIDCLTGDHQVIRADIVMDLGCSLNPAIDIGQIEGAFMQGYGLYTMEEMIYSPKGQVLSKGMYKIPSYSDIPGKLNVTLLSNFKNKRAVFSSKAVGEPPLFGAASVFFAIKDAISSARIDSGLDPYFDLMSPATCARIRMACKDHITEKITISSENNEYLPWNVIP